MTDFNLNLTGAQVDSALNKVHSADSTPTNGSSNMVSSSGVYTYIQNTIANPITVTYDPSTETLTITSNA